MRPSTRSPILAAVVGVMTGLGIALAGVRPALHAQGAGQTPARNVLNFNCSIFTLPAAGEHNTILDPENKVIHVHASQNGQDIDIDLPFEPDGDFRGCSAGARRLLRHVNEDYREYIRESCEDFTDIIEARKQLVPKNGILPNVQGARDFVAKHCR